MKIKIVVAVAVMAALLGSAAAKETLAEAELRQRLAASEARAKAADDRAKAAESRAAQAQKDKDALNAKLSAQGATAATATKAASNVATTEAQIAQINSDNQAQIAAKAAQDAKASADQAVRVANANNAALLINGFYALLTLVITGVGTFAAGEWRRSQDRKQADRVAIQADAKLNQIHTLVNSNLTAAKKETLVERKANLVLLREAAKTPESMEAIRTMQSSIAELEADLADRLVQTDTAQREVEIQEAKWAKV